MALDINLKLKMKKFKTVFFLYFTLPAIVALILLYFLVVSFFTYKFRNIMLERIKEDIPLIVERISLDRSRIYIRMPGRTRDLAFIVFNKDRKIIKKFPKNFNKKRYIKINKRPYYEPKRDLYFTFFVRRNRILSGKDKLFLRDYTYYLAVIFLGLITLFFYFSRRFSKEITLFFRKNNKVFESIANGFYDVKMVNEYEEFLPLERGIKKMCFYLEKEEIRKKEFILNFSHDLKTPLTIIKGTLEGVKDKVLECNDETLNSMNEEIVRMEKMIETVKLFGKEEKEKVLIDLLEYFKKKKEHYKNLIFIELSGESIYIFFDKKELDTIVDNIIENGYKYNSQAEKRMKISFFQDGTDLIISFKDNGIGIDEEHIQYIFDKFYRANDARVNDGSMGLGLSLVKEYVEKNEGMIEVDSKIGAGTSFKIIFFNRFKEEL